MSDYRSSSNLTPQQIAMARGERKKDAWNFDENRHILVNTQSCGLCHNVAST